MAADPEVNDFVDVACLRLRYALAVDDYTFGRATEAQFRSELGRLGYGSFAIEMEIAQHAPGGPRPTPFVVIKGGR